MVLGNGTFRACLPTSVMLYSAKFIKQTSCWCCTPILGESPFEGCFTGQGCTRYLVGSTM